MFSFKVVVVESCSIVNKNSRKFSLKESYKDHIRKIFQAMIELGSKMDDPVLFYLAFVFFLFSSTQIKVANKRYVLL